MLILSIDVGIKHLGLVWSDVAKTTSFKDIKLLDMTAMLHKKVKKAECKLYHDNCICDWLEHLFQEIEWFVEADHILIEKQPLSGLIAVEQLIMSRFRNKTHLVSPNAMHAWFGISQFDYERRKENTVKLCSHFFEQNQTNEQVLETFKNLNRKHDIADAVCLLMFWLKRVHHHTPVTASAQTDFSVFRFKSNQ